MTIQNGDACPDGTLRGITVKFTCDSRSVGPQTFTILETTTYVCGCSNVCGGVRGQMLVLRRVGWMLRCARQDRGLQFQHRAALRSQQPSRTAAACTYTRTPLLPTLSSPTSEIQCVLSSPLLPTPSSPHHPLLSLSSLSLSQVPVRMGLPDVHRVRRSPRTSARAAGARRRDSRPLFAQLRLWSH